MLTFAKRCGDKATLLLSFSIIAAVGWSCSDQEPIDGTQMFVGADVAGYKSDAERNHAMTAAESRIRKRLQKFGISFSVELNGTNFVVSIGTRDQKRIDEIRHKIEANAFFEMRGVHPRSDDLIKENTVPRGYELAHFMVPRNGNSDIDKPLIITSGAIDGLTSRHIKHAYPERISKSSVVNIEFDEIGTTALANFSVHHSDERVAILIDRQVLCTAIMSPMTNGRAQLTGYFDDRQAIAIANILENPVEAPLQVNEIRTFSR